MPIRIDKPPNLAPDRRGVFDRLSRRVSASGADAAYDALKGAHRGRVISVDVARFLVPEFQSWSGRVRHTPSTGSPAGAYAHDRLLRELARTRSGAQRLLITAGGAGSGKTSQLRGLPQIAGLVFDNQFKDLDRARTILRLAIRHKWDTEVVYVHRPFADVVRAVIERSQRTGRWNNLSELARMHAQAQRTLLAVWQEFGSRVNIHAIYNAQQGAGDLPPGSRVLLKHLRPGARYHVSEDEKAHAIIPGILDQAIDEGIVCVQVARIIAQRLRGWKPRT